MIEPDDLTPQSTPQVASVGGGASARIGAVVVAGVLATVVWIGLSGRSAIPQPLPLFPEVAVQPTPAATTDAQPTPTPDPAAGPVPRAPDDVFGVYAELGDSQFITILAEPELDHLTGHLRIPIPPPTTDGIFAFQQFSPPSALGLPVHIADWPVDIGGLATAGSGESDLVDVSVPGRRAISGGSRPTMRGYRLEVRAQRAEDSIELIIDVRIGPGRQIVGDDGIYGWPMVALIPGPEPVAQVAPYLRERGRYNYCRWDLSPLSAPPMPGTDEADC